MRLVIVIIVVFCSVTLSCNRNASSFKTVAKTHPYDQSASLSKELMDYCQVYVDSVWQRNTIMKEYEIFCCIVECTSNGNKECEKYILDKVNSLYLNDHEGNLFCGKTNSDFIRSRLIFEATIEYLRKNMTTLFKCGEKYHGASDCKASGYVSMLYSSLHELKKGQVDWSKVDELEKNLNFDPWSEEECFCNRAKFDFMRIEKLYERGAIELYNYSYQARK